METYKYIIGQINALESVQQEISNLLNDKEQNEDRGTVINIGDKKNNNPKHELVGLKKSEPKPKPKKEITKETTKLPQPTGWRMLVLPFRMKEKTDAGLLIGSETIDRQQVASQCGNVLAMGKLVTRIKKDILVVHGARSVIGWSSHVMQDHV